MLFENGSLFKVTNDNTNNNILVLGLTEFSISFSIYQKHENQLHERIVFNNVYTEMGYLDTP